MSREILEGRKSYMLGSLGMPVVRNLRRKNDMVVSVVHGDDVEVEVMEVSRRKRQSKRSGVGTR